MKKTLAAAALLLALAGLTGCTNDANPARITGPGTPITKVAEATQPPKPEVQPTKAAEPVPVAEPVATAPAAPVVPAEVVPAAPVQPAAIDWAADARAVSTGGSYLGTWSDQVHFGTAPDVEVVPSQAHPGFFHFFAVNKQKPVCQEDQPCFDCKTMGNKICGPVTPPAAPTCAQLNDAAGKVVCVDGPSCVPVFPTPDASKGVPMGYMESAQAALVSCLNRYYPACTQDFIDLMQGSNYAVSPKTVTGFAVTDGKCTISSNS